MKPERLNKHSAFTLVELLTVIAIVGIIASLLLAALSRGAGLARRSYCANNLRQQGVALQEFRTDHHFYPPYFDATVNLSSPNPEERYWMAALQNEMDPSHTDNYRNTGVWQCPSGYRTTDMSIHWAVNDYNYNVHGLGSWNLAKAIGSLGLSEPWVQNRRTQRVSESEVVVPSEMFAIGDALYGGPSIIEDCQLFGRGTDQMVLKNAEAVSKMPDELKYDTTESTKRAHVRHQNKANVVFCDGHVESPTLQFLFADTSDEALSRWNRDHLPHRERLVP